MDKSAFADHGLMMAVAKTTLNCLLDLTVSLGATRSSKLVFDA